MRRLLIGCLLALILLASVGCAAPTPAPSSTLDVVATETAIAAKVLATLAAQAADTPWPTNTPEPTSTSALIPTNTPVPPTSTQKPTIPSPPGTANIVISYIFYDGVVKRVESDEYAQITNNGSVPVNLKGWRLNAGDPGQDFWFPDFAIGPGQSCRVYTNEYHPESCGFSFGSGRAIWNNKGDCGYLYDATGTVVSEYCY